MIIKQEQMKDDKVERAPAWLISFADVSALLLAFFVMLFSMSTLKTEEYDKIVSNLQIRDDSMPKEELNADLSDKSVELSLVTPAEGPEYLATILENKILESKHAEHINVTLNEQFVVLEIKNSNFRFNDGLYVKNILNDKSEIFRELSSVLQQIPNRIILENVIEFSSENENVAGLSWNSLLEEIMEISVYISEQGYGQALDVFVQYKKIVPKEQSESISGFDIQGQTVNIVIYPERGNT